MKIVKHPLSYYVDPIVAGNPYSFARFGDGEWASILGKRKHPKKNCDGHFFFPEMRDEYLWMFRCLRDEPLEYLYWLGMQNMAMGMWPKPIKRFLERYGLDQREWHNCDVFHHASRKGQIEPLIDALRQRSVVVVGPEHLKTLDKVFGYNGFVRVPRQNCYLQIKRIVRQTAAAIEAAPKPVVVSISASMPAELIIHRLFKDHGDHAFLIDFGSVFDPYAGVASRQYHQGMKLNDIRAISPGASPAVAAGSVRRPRPRKVRSGRRK
jgi:hypothetical protein